MEAFLGTWKMETSEGFDEVMQKLGVGFLARKAGNTLKPNFIVKDLGNGKYCMRTESTFKNTEANFSLGEQFKESTADGREVSSVVTLESSGILKQIQTDEKNKVTHIEREVYNGGKNLKVTVKVDDAVCVRTYSKAA